MALYPEAKLRLLPENRTQPHITPRAFIAHSQAGGGSLYGFWLNGTDLESTIWVSFAGLVEQYMDTVVRADANGAANGYATSAETESSVQATERWTPAQAAALVRFIVWWCRTHGVSPVLMTSPTGAGLAYHVLFGAPGPWTKARGKTCPGAARIRQFVSEIIPMVVAQLTKGAAPSPTPIPAPSPDQLEELTMADITAIIDTIHGQRPVLVRRGDKRGQAYLVDGMKITAIPRGAAGTEMVDSLIITGQCQVPTGEGANNGDRISIVSSSWVDALLAAQA